MDDTAFQTIRLKTLELAQGILNAKLMTMSGSSDWNASVPTTEEVIAEATKLTKFIQGR